MDAHVTRLTLSNGLLVLLKEIHTAPLVSQWLWYRVGSRNEPPDRSGLSHWVEHIQFKGTPRYPPGVLDKAISRSGGVWNAFTTPDWTTYFETLPADKSELALELEADRMMNSRFDPNDIEIERTVIISERQGSENDPDFLLSEQVQAAAFQVHPYQHEVIGAMADLESIQGEDLYQHYRTHYIPNNAVLAIAGDFKTGTMLKRVQRHFEPIPAGPPPPAPTMVEPPQTEERYVNVEGPGETTYVQVSYHVPEGKHRDFSALSVLDSLLSGPGDVSIFGGGLSNKTCRLYRALVEAELAVSVYGGLLTTIDPYLYSLGMIVCPDKTGEQVVKALDEAISQVQEMPPAAEELGRAVKQARALFAYNNETITNQAARLGLAEMFADQEWLDTYLERLAAVTPEAVQAAARAYLRPENRVVGVYTPKEAG